MQSFKDYIISEYTTKAPNFSATEFKFIHSQKHKLDKKSQLPIYSNTIRINIKFYDKDMNILHSDSLTFENNLLSPSSKKALINISPAELENRFNTALPTIYNNIMTEYITSLESIDSKIKALQRYLQFNKTITPSEFKGESIQIISSSLSKTKSNFDM